MKRFLLVVARFNEDVSWTKHFDGSELVDVLVYNKGADETPPGSVQLENVGREGHTYFTHIVRNYPDLHEFTIFVQGNPFDHSPFLLRDIDRLASQREDPPPRFKSLCKRILTTRRSRYLIDIIYAKAFGVPMPDVPCHFGAGAQFLVSRDAILDNEKKVYANLVNILESSVDPPEGYGVERMHHVIFDPPQELLDRRRRGI